MGKDHWAEAEAAYAALGALSAPQQDLKAVGEAGRNRMRERRAVAMIQDAEDASARGQHDKALALLGDAFGLEPEQHLQDRIRSKYYQTTAKAISARVIESTGDGAPGAECVVVAGEDAEATAIRDRVCVEVAESKRAAGRAGSVPASLERELLKGQFDAIPTAEQERLKGLGPAFFLIARDGREFGVYRIETGNRKTSPLCRVARIGPAPGRPARGVWDKLVSKARTDADFRVQVWTDRGRYRTGEDVVFHVSATRDCYVTLLDLQTSGNLALLLPNQYEPSALVRAGQTVSIPAASAAFAINASGPAGFEGVKALATLKPLVAAERPADRVFFQTNRPDEQLALCRKLAEKCAALDPREWDVAEWTFQIE